MVDEENYNGAIIAGRVDDTDLDNINQLTAAINSHKSNLDQAKLNSHSKIQIAQKILELTV